MKKHNSCLTWLCIIAVVAVSSALLIPNFVRARSRGVLTACKSNLKNIGTALEMYSANWNGQYPKSLNPLTPNYLKTIPECPGARRVTYNYSVGRIPINKFACSSHNAADPNEQCAKKLNALNQSVHSQRFDPALEPSTLLVCPDGQVYRYDAYCDTYWIYCKGSNHEEVSVPADYPQYNGVEGLIDR